MACGGIGGQGSGVNQAKALFDKIKPIIVAIQPMIDGGNAYNDSANMLFKRANADFDIGHIFYNAANTLVHPLQQFVNQIVGDSFRHRFTP
jgi:hypothetical protein